ncbi:hypothetical protein ABLO27_14075 [Roseibium sp. SCPC15]
MTSVKSCDNQCNIHDQQPGTHAPHASNRGRRNQPAKRPVFNSPTAYRISHDDERTREQAHENPGKEHQNVFAREIETRRFFGDELIKAPQHPRSNKAGARYISNEKKIKQHAH